jgi:predicted CoA-binding protein
MSKLREKVEKFLSLKRIAVAGVSRNSGPEAANLIYRKLKEAGYEVYALNPHAESTDGDTCYPNLSSLPVKVEGAVLVTPPQNTEEIVKECQKLGVNNVWMHRSFGKGSVSGSAVNFCKDNGIEVIAGACPMMYCQPVDLGHKCMKWALGFLRKLPG